MFERYYFFAGAGAFAAAGAADGAFVAVASSCFN
jgi:hypothetical protein